MFEPFKQRYKVTSRVESSPSAAIVTCPLEETPGYEEFIREYAGATFNDGVYRVHTLNDRAKWNGLITEAFPKYKGRFSVFAYDWVGRHFALDSRRREKGEPLVLLFDPGFGEVLQIPGTFRGFHDQVLVTDSDGNRYEFPDVRKLDDKSFAVMQRVL